MVMKHSIIRFKPDAAGDRQDGRATMPVTVTATTQVARYREAIDGIHDMGGMHGFGPVVVPGSDAVYHEPWEGRTFAMSTLVGIERIGTGSGRAIREEMDPEHYLRASYYERWLWSTEERLLRKGSIAGSILRVHSEP